MLNKRQSRFIEEYLVDFNATRAAIAAGYNNKTATSQASRLLKKPEIQKALASRQKDLSEKIHVTQEAVVQELAAIGFSNLFDYLSLAGQEIKLQDLSALSPEKQRALASLRNTNAGVEVKTHDKIRALELLIKYLNLDSTQTAENNLLEAILSTAESGQINYDDIAELKNASSGT